MKAFQNYNYFIADFIILFFDYLSFYEGAKTHPSQIISVAEDYIKGHHPWRVFDYNKLNNLELSGIHERGIQLQSTLKKINENLKNKLQL